MQSTSFDLVIGSDLVYEEEGMRALVRGFDPNPNPRSGLALARTVAQPWLQPEPEPEPLPVNQVRVFAVLAARGVRILYAHTRYPVLKQRVVVVVVSTEQ